MRTIIRSALVALVAATVAKGQAIPAGAVYLSWPNLHIALAPDSSGARMWVAVKQRRNERDGFSATFVPGQVEVWAEVALELLDRPLGEGDSAIARASGGLRGHVGDLVYVMRRRDKTSWMKDRFLVLESVGDTVPTVIRGSQEEIKSIVQSLAVVAKLAPYDVAVANRRMLEGDGDMILDSPPSAKRSNIPPEYPEAARLANTQGMVVLTFFVEADGRANVASAKPFSASHQVFLESVLRRLPSFRFDPAIKDGKPIRLLVTMPFRLLAGAVVYASHALPARPSRTPFPHACLPPLRD